MVYIVDVYGNALMPTNRYGKVRRLLQSNMAKVVKRTPFTVQLLYGTTNHVQPVSLGIDAGIKHIGVSATTTTKVLFEADVALRTDIVELLATRRQYRSARRSRKTRYRKARFDNRRRKEGWLPPSIQNRVAAHLKVVHMVKDILPISEVTVEVAQFDIQKIKNPSISGVEYQQGELLDSWNVREYVLFRDKHTCQFCKGKGKSKDKILNVHHIRSRKAHGDRPGNLIALCETCHDKIHTEGLENYFSPKDKGFKDESQMTIMRWFIHNGIKAVFPQAKLTYGYITKHTRINNRLEKSHMIDARCVSGNPLAKATAEYYLIKQVRKNNRQLHKATILKGGVRKANKAPYLVKGFRLFDKVSYLGKECFIFGRRTSGHFDLRLLNGTKVSASAGCKKLRLLEKSKTLLIERRLAFPPTTEVTGVHAVCHEIREKRSFE
jgi:N6-L-threonylcarbamoyladenine synthase